MLRVTKIPEPITAFIKAINNHNTDEFLDVLTDGAVITDEGHDYRGIAAIKEWSDEKCIGANVTFDAISAVERDGENIVTAKVDGNFDKTGLPDPFYMDLHFTIEANRIAALNFRLAGE